jgi:hypothetical protein
VAGDEVADLAALERELAFENQLVAASLLESLPDPSDETGQTHTPA